MAIPHAVRNRNDIKISGAVSMDDERQSYTLVAI